MWGLFTRLQWRSPTVRRSSDQAIPQPLWKLGQLNHVAIAVPDLEKATALYRDVLRASVSEVLPLPDHGVYTVFVDNIANAIEELKRKKIRVLSDEPQIGAHGKPVVFLHPKDCDGVLVELEQA
ncbi:hypothetical protein E2320_013260 [Naja naja]|nr:hypothetical protein E2320_013260 [Naja naja]